VPSFTSGVVVIGAEDITRLYQSKVAKVPIDPPARCRAGLIDLSAALFTRR
jgi:hypothetical protein